MNQEFVYETIPFEMEPEFEDEMFELENERGSRRTFGGRTSRGFRPSSRIGIGTKGNKRPPVAKPKPRPAVRGRRRLTNIIHEPYLPGIEPYPPEPEPSGSEHIRWVQDCLNQAMGLNLPVTGVMGPETRSAVRSFQRQQRLRVSGIVGPDTEDALKAVCTSHIARTTDSGRGDGSTAEEVGEAFSIGATGELSEEEYTVPKNTRVTLTGHEPLPLYSPIWKRQLPRLPGIYFIYEGSQLRYVGKAKSIRDRFSARFGAFEEFGIPDATYYQWLKNSRTNVRLYLVTDSNTGKPYSYNDTLGALEEYFINMHGTRTGQGRNRDRPQPVNFSKGGLTINYRGVHHDTRHQNNNLTRI